MNSMLANEPATTANAAAQAMHAAPLAPANSPLHGELRKAVWDYCRELAAVCRSDAHEFEGTGLARGRIGPAQFLAAWHRATGDADARDAALAHAQATLETMGGDPLRFDWIGGLTGTTWALRRIAWLDDEPLDPDFSDEIDRTLTLRLGVAQWTGDYDLISGVVGDGLYALDHPDRAWRDRLVGAALAHLVKLARTNENGTTWFTEPHLLPEHQRVLFPNGYHNLGLAHGVPGVIGLLARCIESDCHAQTARPLLDGAMRWLQAQSLRLPGREPSTGEKGYFASFAESDRPTRLAWCYGDLGVCAAVLRAADATGRADWRAFALEIARDCASRSADECFVNDMGICHGSAGAALVFLRLWQQLGDESLAQAARFWAQRTLDMRLAQFPHTAGVFRAEWEDGQYFPVACVSWITGAAGVGLALLSCLTGDPDAWDAPYLTDLPRGAQQGTDLPRGAQP